MPVEETPWLSARPPSEIEIQQATLRRMRGLATGAVAALTNAAFALPGVSRIEIRCDARNHPSAAVAEKLGYQLVRIDHREPQAPAESGELMIWATWRPD